MDVRVVGIVTGLGIAHSIMNEKKGKSNRKVVIGSAIGVCTCFFGGTRLEYMNILRGKKIKVISPANAFYLSGFYSLGAFSGAILSRAILSTSSLTMLSSANLGLPW